jgi:hypothetical protein
MGAGTGSVWVFAGADAGAGGECGGGELSSAGADAGAFVVGGAVQGGNFLEGTPPLVDLAKFLVFNCLDESAFVKFVIPDGLGVNSSF